MSTPETPDASPERRTLRWLLGGQIVLAVLLIGIDLAPGLPGLVSPSSAPELDAPTRPGDQTRRYRPTAPSNPGPGVSSDMPRRLVAEITEAGLRLRGAIAPGDGARIVTELRAAAPGTVTLDSPGGSVSDALEIGRFLRDADVTTRIEDGAVCLSACPYAFAGGTTREVAEGGRLGVHQHSFGESTVLPAFLATEDIQRGQAEVLAHLDAMGIDLRIMGPAMATPANEIYILTPQELSDWNVVTAPE
ncbi:COG3904 family protein [Jannaschia marina]|uniref:COG3904 family protein n=1 Tax=Jannaschia marina TaxID=2741674 RepID=UPI0015CA0A46|nr:hypothetical protein [Jannaschia marina]